MFNNKIIHINTRSNAISEMKMKDNVKIKPNPFDELITLELNNMIGGDYQIEIFNIQGQLIQNQIILSNSTNMDMSKN